MDGISICGMILDPVDTGGLGVANVGNVVDMAFDRILEISRYCTSLLYPPEKLASTR